MTPFAHEALAAVGGEQSDATQAGLGLRLYLADGAFDRRQNDRPVEHEIPYIDHSATLLDPSSRTAWVTAINLKRNLIIGWVFSREEFPWLQIWGNFPATGKMARGLEFSTQPFDVPRRDAVSAPPLFDTPWFRWLPAKSRIETKFLVFYARIPDGFRKVDEVKIQNGRIRVADNKAQKEINLEASLSNHSAADGRRRTLTICDRKKQSFKGDLSRRKTRTGIPQAIDRRAIMKGAILAGGAALLQAGCATPKANRPSSRDARRRSSLQTRMQL